MSVFSKIRKTCCSLTLVPNSFFYFLPLSLGADIIIVSGIINKASGFYGILSLLTGARISVKSWLLNIFSLFAFPLYSYAYYALKTQNLLFLLVFVHFYLIDHLVNIGFTIAFCVKWFAHAGDISNQGSIAPSIGNNVATSVKNLVTTTISLVTETATSTPTSSLQSAADEEFILIAASASARNVFERAINTASKTIPALATTTSVVPSTQPVSTNRESVLIIISVISVLLVRTYFAFVLIGYIRQLFCNKPLSKPNNQPRIQFFEKLQHALLTPFKSLWNGVSPEKYSPLLNDSK